MSLPHRATVSRPLRRPRAAVPDGPIHGDQTRPAALPLSLHWLLGALVFSAFLSGVKLVPGIGTNIGPFEILAGLITAFFLLDPRNRTQLRLPVVSKILLATTIWAALSQLVVRPENIRTGFIQTMILVSLFLVVTVLYNIARRYRTPPTRLLTLITLAVLIVGPWVVYSGVSSGGNIQASGPFRNRAHVATYMLTAFWLVVIFLLLPAVRKRMRLAGYLAAASSLYAVAVSGRRSVYLSLFLGLVAMSAALVLAHRGKRLRMFVTAAFAVAFIGLFYTYGARLFPQADFFQHRLGSVGSRLRAFVAPSQAPEAESNFYLLQREGVRQAFFDNPLIGVGWGGFVNSVYSPTGHEVHSTPLRFLAEMGIVGLLLYLSLIGHLLFDSVRLFFQMRRTPYGGSYLALAVATWSLSVSYVYNRHITERTFWLFLGVFLTMQVFARLAEPTGRRRTSLPAAATSPTGRPLGASVDPVLPSQRVGRRIRQRGAPAAPRGRHR